MPPFNLIKDRFADVTTVSEVDLSNEDHDRNFLVFVGVEKATGTLLMAQETECSHCGDGVHIKRGDLFPVTPEGLEKELQQALKDSELEGEIYREKVQLAQATLAIVEKLTTGQALPR